MLWRNTLTGEVADLGAPPEPCAVGFTSGGEGAALSQDFQRIWLGADLDVMHEFDIRTLPLTAPFRNRSVMVVEEWWGATDHAYLLDTVTGDPIGPKITDGIALVAEPHPDESVYAVSLAYPNDPEGDGRLIMLDTETGNELWRMNRPDAAEALDFDPRTGDLVAGYLGGEVLTIDSVTGQILSRVVVPDVSTFLAIRVDADGATTAVSAAKVFTVDRVQGESRVVTPLRSAAEAWFAPEGRIVVGTADGLVEVYDLEQSAFIPSAYQIDVSDHVAIGNGVATVLDGPAQIVETIDLVTGDRTSQELRGADGEPLDIVLALPADEGV